MFWSRHPTGGGMNRTESQFCLDEAERLLKLAEHCSDKKVQQHLRQMAQDWTARAKFKIEQENAPKIA
jgi:hypothetical protein